MIKPILLKVKPVIRQKSHLIITINGFNLLTSWRLESEESFVLLTYYLKDHFREMIYDNSKSEQLISVFFFVCFKELRWTLLISRNMRRHTLWSCRVQTVWQERLRSRDSTWRLRREQTNRCRLELVSLIQKDVQTMSQKKEKKQNKC